MSNTLRLDLDVLLPDVPDTRDACVARLEAELAGRPGVSKAHVVEGEAGSMLCLHYDPERLSLPDLRRVAQSAGAQITDRYRHVVWEADGLTNQRRARTVVERLQKVPGVVEAAGNAGGPIRIEFDRKVIEEPALVAALGTIGVRVKPSTGAGAVHAHEGESSGGERHDHNHGHGSDTAPGHDQPGHVHADGEGAHAHKHGGLFGERTEIIFAILAGVCAVGGWLLERFAGVPADVTRWLFIAGYFFGGFFVFREAIESIRAGRFEIDFLMLVAAGGAAALGEWFDGALLLFLFSLGHALEHYAMGRARRAIEALGQIAPETARLKQEDGMEKEVPVGELKAGDRVLVRPDERVPADGFVASGESAVNQAPITGESVPVDKCPVSDAEAALREPERVGAESRVFAGTLNGSGPLEIVVTRAASESTLARVVRLVTEAETTKSPTQRFTDRFEKVFVPAVLVAVALLLIVPLLVMDEPFAATFYRAMAVLVAASPCALAIATPSAVLSGVARSGRAGILVKGGAPLEALGGVRTIAFDKTGTLTEGMPRVTDVVPSEGATEPELVSAAVAVESLSDHPLAKAVTRDLRGKVEGALPAAENLQSVTGQGLQATVEGDPVWVGKLAMFEKPDGTPLPKMLVDEVNRLKAGGRSTFVVRRADRYLGAIGLMDTPREAAKGALAQLTEMGIARTIMLSGDAQPVADAVAKEVGLTEARGDLMPEDKVSVVKELARDGGVTMVGDGVNDAPALASATVGIAMGAAGSDVALETADVALMGDDLSRLPFAIHISRATRRVIRQNLWMSLGMVAVLIPATIFGLGIGPAVALHEGSTLVVVFNALRLLALRDR